MRPPPFATPSPQEANRRRAQQRDSRNSRGIISSRRRQPARQLGPPGRLTPCSMQPGKTLVTSVRRCESGTGFPVHSRSALKVGWPVCVVPPNRRLRRLRGTPRFVRWDARDRMLKSGWAPSQHQLLERVIGHDVEPEPVVHGGQNVPQQRGSPARDHPGRSGTPSSSPAPASYSAAETQRSWSVRPPRSATTPKWYRSTRRLRNQ